MHHLQELATYLYRDPVREKLVPVVIHSLVDEAVSHEIEFEQGRSTVCGTGREGGGGLEGESI